MPLAMVVQRGADRQTQGVRLPGLMLMALLLAGCAQVGPRQGELDGSIARPTLALDALDRFSSGIDAPKPSDAAAAAVAAFETMGLINAASGNVG